MISLAIQIKNFEILEIHPKKCQLPKSIANILLLKFKDLLIRILRTHNFLISSIISPETGPNINERQSIILLRTRSKDVVFYMIFRSII